MPQQFAAYIAIGGENMVGFRIPGLLNASNATTGHSRTGCVAGFPPGPLGLTAGRGRSEIGDSDGLNKYPVPGTPQQQPFSELESNVVNASAFTPSTRAKAGEGVRLIAIRLLPTGTVLYRIGSTKKFGAPLPVDSNFESPWWMRKNEFDRILAKGLQDTSWAARVLPAIATAWGTECDLQVAVTTEVDLYAWVGEGKAIDYAGMAVSDSNPGAYWFPEKDLLQLYIPGLKELPGGRANLWQSAFGARSVDPWLPIGSQRNVATGKPFVPRAESSTVLPPGKR
jgi:hypothetical protein